MGPEAAGTVLACIVIFLITVHVAGGSVRAVSGMFRAPDLGWPSGVQEDDDLHWTWAPPAQGASGTRTRPADPELLELEPSSPGLVVQPVRHSPRT